MLLTCNSADISAKPLLLPTDFFSVESPEVFPCITTEVIAFDF